MERIDLNDSPESLWAKVVDVGIDTWGGYVEVVLEGDRNPAMERLAAGLKDLPVGEIRDGADWADKFAGFPESFIVEEDVLMLRVIGLGAVSYCLFEYGEKGPGLIVEIGMWLPDWLPGLTDERLKKGKTPPMHPEWKVALDFIRHVRDAGNFGVAFLAQEGEHWDRRNAPVPGR
jgi:hypothetical protein